MSAIGMPPYRIEKGIPLPMPQKYGGAPRQVTSLSLVLEEMEVGDSFFVAGYGALDKGLFSRCRNWAAQRYLHRSFATRRAMVKDVIGTRVWRIA